MSNWRTRSPKKPGMVLLLAWLSGWLTLTQPDSIPRLRVTPCWKQSSENGRLMQGTWTIWNKALSVGERIWLGVQVWKREWRYLIIIAPSIHLETELHSIYGQGLCRMACWMLGSILTNSVSWVIAYFPVPQVLDPHNWNIIDTYFLGLLCRLTELLYGKDLPQCSTHRKYKEMLAIIFIILFQNTRTINASFGFITQSVKNISWYSSYLFHNHLIRHMKRLHSYYSGIVSFYIDIHANNCLPLSHSFYL